jgi:hypothetical protein
MKRVIAIIGVGPLLQAIRGRSARISVQTLPHLTIEVDPPSSANAFPTASGGSLGAARG